MASVDLEAFYDVVVVGGGIAAISCTQQLCTLDPERKILLLAESQTLKGIRNVIHITANLADFEIYEQSLAGMESKHANLAVRRGSVRSVNSRRRRLVFAPFDSSSSRSTSVSYAKLCVCSGARPHTLFPEHENVIGIRDSDSVERLRTRLKTANCVALVGNGGIALELVCALRHSAAKVVWITKDHFVGNTFLDASASEWLSGISTFLAAGADTQCNSSCCSSTSSCSSVKHSKSASAPVEGDGGTSSLQVPHTKRTKVACCPKHARVPPHRLTSETASSTGPANDNAGSNSTTRDKSAHHFQGSGHAVGPEWTRSLAAGRESSKAASEPPSRNVVWKPGQLVVNVVTASSVPSSELPHDSTNSTDSAWPVYLTLSSGEVFGCDFLVSATGVTPNAPFLGTEFARSPIDGGVLVNRRLQTPGVPHTYCAGDVCTVDQELPLQNEDGTQVVPEKSPLWFQMRLWSQARTMGQLAALSILGMHDVVDASMFFELFTHVSTFFGFKVTLLGAYNGQQLPHSDDVQTQVVTQDGVRGPCKPSAVTTGRNHTGSRITSADDVALDPGVQLHAAPSALANVTARAVGDEREASLAGTDTGVSHASGLTAEQNDDSGEDVSTQSAQAQAQAQATGGGKTADLQILVRVTPGVEYVKLVLWRGRIAGALLIGDTDLEETFENLILSQFDCSELGIDLLDPNVDIEDYFD